MVLCLALPLIGYESKILSPDGIFTFSEADGGEKKLVRVRLSLDLYNLFVFRINLCF